MRFLLRIKLPNEYGNSMIKNPQFLEKLNQMLEELKPEATYFGPVDGVRGMYLIVNLKDESELVRVTEPFFLGLHAEIEPVLLMVQDDLRKAGAYIEAAVKKWG
jgi:hypothetical protein